MEIAQDKSGDALYRTGYLCMDLPFVLNEDIANYTVQELGTFVHEYVHYLQNITTPWGLYEACRLYERISYCFKQLVEDDGEILYLPIDEEYKVNHKDIIDILNCGRGFDVDLQNLEVYHLKYANEPKFQEFVDYKKIGDHDIPKVILQFETEKHGIRKIVFGAWAIKESMAALIQEKIDPSSPTRHADVPYNLIYRLAIDKYPNIASDKDKLISICFASLYSLKPGIQFLYLAAKANEYPQMTSDELLTDFFSKKVNLNDKYTSFHSLYEQLSKKFLVILSKLLYIDPLKYIPTIINLTQFKDKRYPLLWFLGSDINVDYLKRFIDETGIPAICGPDDSGIFPSIDDCETSQLEIVNLIGYETLYKFVTSKPPTCPRLKLCEDAGKCRSSCLNTPWDRSDPCPMKEIAKLLEIQYKHVIKK